MKNSELVKYIESKYDVNSIKFKSLDLWLELRVRVYLKISLGEESTLKITNKTYIGLLSSIFYGFFNWFRKYDAWFFSSQINRVLIEDKYYDRIFDYPASQYKKSLFIELTTSKHYKKSKINSKYIVSRSLLILIEKTISIFISTKKVNLDAFNKILEEFNIEVNPSYSIKKMISQYLMMRFLLKIKKPKIVYVSPSYTCFGYIKAFKEKKIKVVEIQHGVIVKEHFGYFIHAKFDRNYFVDNLLTFGEKEIEAFNSENKGIDEKSIYPVGNFYLDYINENYVKNLKIDVLLQPYKFSFLVSLQELDVPLKIIPEIIHLAKKNQDSIFILKPRKKPKSFYINAYKFPNNIVIIDDENIYQLIKSTDFHVTVYSTTAIEAPALGKRNILFNIENKSKIILGDSLQSSDTSIYVNNWIEFDTLLKDLIIHNEQDVKNAHKNVITPNYQQRINEILKSF